VNLSGTTAGFGATSGGAAIIAGAALVVQGIADARLGYCFGPRQLRALLSDPALGTVSNDPPNDKLGVMPNLRSIIESDALAVGQDVYIRDFVGDGGDPHVSATARVLTLFCASHGSSTPRQHLAKERH
jgi:hypothetical protein